MLGHYPAGFTLNTDTPITDQIQKAISQRMQGVMNAGLPDDQLNPPQNNACKVIEFKKSVNSYDEKQKPERYAPASVSLYAYFYLKVNLLYLYE